MLWAFSDSTVRSSPTAYNAARRRFLDLQATAEETGRKFIGGVWQGRVYAGSYRADSLFLLATAYSIASRDSALVVLVDHADSVGGAPAVVGLTRITTHLPPAFWGIHWMSGDTSFSVHGQPSALLDTLRTSPTVGQFLAAHGAP